MKYLKKVLSALVIMLITNLIWFVTFNLDLMVSFFYTPGWKMLLSITSSTLIAGWYLGRTLRK